ncbi:DUF6192 family protein [Kitasatospora sp. NPDC085879]|uniref:DUF6192 family protein n=1 Tax=Kitasatospora sp. NPDC085879 TaxID=3154769 RepID=UPI003439A353
MESFDLVTACHAIVGAAGRTVPGLCDRGLGDERVITHENLARMRATRDWLGTAVRHWHGGRRRRAGPSSDGTSSTRLQVAGPARALPALARGRRIPGPLGPLPASSDRSTTGSARSRRSAARRTQSGSSCCPAAGSRARWPG